MRLRCGENEPVARRCELEKGADGVKLRLTLRTTVGSLREKEKQVLEAAFTQAGIGITLANVDASVFYGQPDNPDAITHFPTNLGLATNGSTDPDE